MNEPINQSDPTPEAPAPVSEPVSPTPVAAPQPRRRLGAWVIVLVLVAIIAAGLYLVYRYGQSKTASVTPPKKDVALLRVAAAEPLPISWYPNIDDSAYTSDINVEAFEGLTSFYDLTKVGPQLALNWTNPDASTWIFKLRPNVKFHTGRTMTATDVKASLEDIQNYDFGQEYGSTIKEVSVVDPLTVKITTNGPDAILPNELANLYIYDTTSKTPNDPINGTGPYTLKPGTNIKDSVDMVPFDDYYGGRPYVRELKFLSYDSEDATIAAVKAGQVDIANVFSKSNADSISSPDFVAQALPSQSVAHLVPNTLNGSPLSKLAVRNALMQALDIPALLAARHVDGVPATQIVAPTIPGYDPALTRPAYSVTAAKQALAAAGYPNGFSFTFTYYTSAQDLADEIKRQFALVGVTVKEDPQTDFDVLGAKVFGGHTDMYYNSISTSLVDASDYISPSIDTKMYSNPQLDSIFAKAGQTLDQAKRLDSLKQASDIMVSDRADLPLYVSGQTYIMVRSNLVITQQRLGGDMGYYFSRAYGK